jgi:phosphatidylglycerophosphate synthase
MEASAQALGALKARRTLPSSAGPVAGVVFVLLLLAVLAATVGLSAVGWAVGVASGAVLNAALAYGLARCGLDRLGLADWVTLARATLAVGVAALVADSLYGHTAVAVLVSVAAASLTLDAVDGWLARRTQTAAPFGAQFDGEVDAFLILVLSVYVSRFAGTWVLLMGAARYAFLAAAWPLPWMRARLPPRYWRKVVAATQGIVLTVAAAEVLAPALNQAVLVAALVLLAESFGRDTWWLWTHRAVVAAPGAAGAQPPPDLALPTPDQAGRSRARTGIAAVLTILSGLIVWAALVAPDQPSALTPAGFVRVPLEGLVLVLLAGVLPTTARRVVASIAGPLLALVVIVKVLDIGFFTTFDRPFDPVGDLGNAGIGVETLRAAIGHTAASLIVVGTVLLVVALLVFTTLAVLRLTRVAASRRRWSLGIVGGLSVVWVICSASGAELLSHVPVASTSAAGLIVREMQTVQADIRDEGIFANQIRHDPFRFTPGNQLLTGLRGRDVLLVFVESYGRVSVQGSSFSPAIDELLKRGTTRMKAAGFSARSAFVTSPGFGGISWLAHSTLQSGVWANSQRRYDQLVGTNRFTLSDGFRRAGWRTINFAPADDRAWADGTSFYHYDRLYDRRQLGYRGPNYNYAPLPDQYMFAALERLELSKTHRRPLFAEVDTVSSHMPWDRIPQMVPWSEVGNGSIFNRTPTFTEPSSFWWHPREVKAAYARSLEYSLNTLISFVRHYGRKNLVLVIVGDEQPLPIVSGQGASHDVPISIIAHDPSVLKRISGWRWQPGLLPSPQAPVWRMSAFRDRFLTAYGPARR